jgi:enamine deaminase RidA (YjgF/YER057c/UK114 family)
MPRQYISHNPTLPFSDAVLVDGHTLYISGSIGLVPGTTQVPANVDEEIVLLMEDLVSLQIFCPDVSLWEQFNAIYRTFFSGPLPARAFLGSGPLLFGAHFEVINIAARSGF